MQDPVLNDRHALRGLALACLLAMVSGSVSARADETGPLRVTGLQPEYCVDVDAILLKIENTSDQEIQLSTSIERLSESGKWEEFVADMLGTEPFPLKVELIRFSKHQTRSIRWQPRRTRSELVHGRYRVVANVLARHPPATAHVLGQFKVAKDDCGAKTP
jgi:hypothetical protein